MGGRASFVGRGGSHYIPRGADRTVRTTRPAVPATENDERRDAIIGSAGEHFKALAEAAAAGRAEE